MFCKNSLINSEIFFAVLVFVIAGCQQSSTHESADIALWIDNQPITLDYLKDRISVKVQMWGHVDEIDEKDYARILDIVIDELVQETIIRKKAVELGFNDEIDVLPDEDHPSLSFPEGFELLENAERNWWNRVVNNIELLSYSNQIARYLGGDIDISETEIETAYLERIDFYTGPEVYEYQVIRVNDAELANEIHRQLMRGGAFESLAKKHSNLRGDGALGDIAVKAIGEFPVEIESELSKIDVRQLSPVFRAQDGYYIYKILKKHDSEVLSLEDVRDTLEEDLRMLERTRFFQSWLNRETRKTSVKYGTPLPFGGF
jgi:hypothetical protein